MEIVRGGTSRAHRIVTLATVVASVGALLMIPALPARGEPPRAAVRSVVVDGWQPDGLTRAAGGQAGRYLSDLLPAGDTVLVGADWGGAADVTVEVRARRGIRWGGWQRLDPLDDEHGPDDGSGEHERADAGASEPVWVGPADLLQLRVHAPSAPPPVRLHVVEVSGGDGLAYRPLRGGAGAAWAQTTPPDIIGRADWGADERLRDDRPRTAPRVRFSVVHHTATSNDYTPDEADDVIRAIYAYHTEVRGWDDLAYNFLVDRFGRVYEGRAGGVEEAVVGAHAAGWNSGSTGIALVGNFQADAPPAAAVEALDRLLAWKLDIHHVDPHGTTVEVAGGGATNRYERGTLVELPTVIGHRSTNATACPGDHLFGTLYDPDGRRIVAQRIDAIGMPKAYGGPPPRREQPLAGVRPRWEVAFSEPLDWRLQIRDGAGTLVRAAAGGGDSAVALEWDLRDGAGPTARMVPPGRYTAELTAASGAGPVTPVRTELLVTPPAERYGGAERIATSVELSRWAFHHAGTVVLATAEAFPDALVASPLAGSLRAPVLLVPSDGVPDSVAEEIARLGAERAYIVGGTVRISEAVEEQLARAGMDPARIHRLAGETRYHTAAVVARVVIERTGAAEALLALGAHEQALRAFPDALVAGGFGAARGLPVALVQPGRLPEPTRALLADARPAQGLLVVTTGDAVTPAVQEEARAAAGGVPARRLEGADRYATARLLAEELLVRREADRQRRGPDPYAEPTGLEVVLATGDNWPDALGAAAAAARRGAAFLLAPTETLADAPSARQFLTEHAAELVRAVLSGGPVALSDRVLTEVAEIVVSDGPNRAPAEPWPGEETAALGAVPVPVPGG